MATATELQSLNDIQYKSKIKILFQILIAFALFVLAFLNFYPIGDKIKSIIKISLNGQGCNPNFEEIHMEWLLPKIVVTNLEIPANCLDRAGESLKFPYLTINYNVINFAPIGLPFRIDTSFGGQPMSLYFVLGINSQMIRLKDQSLDLVRLQPILGPDFKLAGNVTMDLNMSMTKDMINNMNFKAQSKNLHIPAQDLSGYPIPSLKLNEFYLEASAEAYPQIKIDKLILGDTEAPIRANLKGKIDLVDGNTAMSPLDLNGEIAITAETSQKLAVLNFLLQSFSQKDGFYQVRLGGTLGSPKPILQ
jgi:type II secretion system protein N